MRGGPGHLCIVSEVETVYGRGEGYSGVSFPGITIRWSPAPPQMPALWTHSGSIGRTPHPLSVPAAPPPSNHFNTGGPPYAVRHCRGTCADPRPGA
jgi:hypothetical protein